MKILVLGGAGFIGQHLTRTLLANGHEVTIVDNLETSIAPDIEGISFIKADLKVAPDSGLLSLFKNHDKIYHFAGSVGVDRIDKDPAGTLINNTTLAFKLIPLFQKANKHVIFSSTSEIYGNGPSFKEDDAAIIGTDKLRWGYASAKLTTEFMIKASSFPYTIVRFFNIVGPGQVGDYGMVLPRFVNAAKAGTPLIVYGDGQQVRSFCHISDAIAALLQVSEHAGQTFNIGSDSAVTTIKNLAQQVIELSNSTSEIQEVPYQEHFSSNHADISVRIPDLTKLKRTINYTPRYNLRDIIRELL